MPRQQLGIRRLKGRAFAESRGIGPGRMLSPNTTIDPARGSAGGRRPRQGFRIELRQAVSTRSVRACR
jgi:hypothetical protein